MKTKTPFDRPALPDWIWTKLCTALCVIESGLCKILFFVSENTSNERKERYLSIRNNWTRYNRLEEDFWQNFSKEKEGTSKAQLFYYYYYYKKSQQVIIQVRNTWSHTQTDYWGKAHGRVRINTYGSINIINSRTISRRSDISVLSEPSLWESKPPARILPTHTQLHTPSSFLTDVTLCSALNNHKRLVLNIHTQSLTHFEKEKNLEEKR